MPSFKKTPLNAVPMFVVAKEWVLYVAAVEQQDVVGVLQHANEGKPLSPVATCRRFHPGPLSCPLLGWWTFTLFDRNERIAEVRT
jgi:hypothetical protein